MKRLFLCGFLLMGGASLLPAQEVVSGIFGYYKLTLLGNSDTIVSIPFARLPGATALVSNVTGNVIQVQNAPGWTNGQFVYAAGVQSNTYYVRFESGALEGRYFAVTNNGTDSVSLNLDGSSLTGVATNNQISLIPYWTFGTVFVDGNGIVPSTSSSLLLQKTQVLIPSTTNTGFNLSSSATYHYYTNGGVANWRRFPATNNLNDDILQPNSYLIIRNKNVATNSTFISYGDVILTKVTFPLRVNPSGKQDNAVSLTRPISVSLADSGLATSGAFVLSTNTSALNRKDELLVFNNLSTNINKSSAATYYLHNSTWRRSGDSITDYGSSNIFDAGSGFIIRKAASATVLLWTNAPTYTNN